jgi:hypothetical protein
MMCIHSATPPVLTTSTGLIYGALCTLATVAPAAPLLLRLLCTNSSTAACTAICTATCTATCTAFRPRGKAYRLLHHSCCALKCVLPVPPVPPSGREAPGKAYRLFTERAFDALDATTLPEIQRTNLASVVLQLKALGINVGGGGHADCAVCMSSS